MGGYNCARNLITEKAPDILPSPVRAVTSAWTHRNLLWQLIKRDVQGRYRGTWGGLAWSLMTPLMMLGIYTFVFSHIFPARWPGVVADTPIDFALVLFSGLSIFGLFQETVAGAPSLVLNQVSYVKKIVFPLEILPWASLGSSMIHLGIALLMLLGVALLAGHPLSFTILALPVVLLPMALGLLGIMWLLAGLGVYLRDIRQPIGVATTGLMFLSPVFYPLSAVPEPYRPLIMLNPVSYFVEEGRRVLLWNTWPEPGPWVLALALSIVIFAGGYIVFQKLRKGFADVL